MFNVTSMKSLGEIKISLEDSMEPNPVAGGNVFETNYCEIISVLLRYAGPNGGRGKWHTLDASRAHEEYHRDVDVPRYLKPLWEKAEATMESQSVACNKSQAEAERILQRTAEDVRDKMLKKFHKQYNAFGKKHNEQYEDGAYDAGQEKLNEMINSIVDRAFDQHWIPCGAPFQGRTSFAKGSLSLRLTNLTATVARSLLTAGEVTQMTVQGAYSDGTASNLTAGASGTIYMADNPGVVSVSSDGRVTAVASGRTIILVSHSPGVDMLPLVEAVDITVRFPDDMDNDRMPDDWERAHGLNPNNASDADQDADGDGITNLEEYRLGTDPRSRDSDGDGVSDGQERIEGSNPMGSAVPDPALQTGLHYFLLMNLDDDEVVQRGIAGDNGVAFNNLILAPNTHYRVFILQASTLELGISDFTTPNSGASITLPAITLRPPRTTDSDNDGLPDEAEWIMGTDARNPDTDNDGIRDGAEVQQGLDPLSNLAVRTGILASADTPGKAVDVCALNDITVVADSNAGITLFSIVNGLNPTRIAQVDTPGNASSVAFSGNLIAVGDETAGLAIVDASDPPAARIIYQINLGSSVRAVAASSGIAYAGLASGQIVSVDMASGTVLERLQVPAAIQDLAIGGDALYALTVGTLYALPLNGDALHVSGSASSPGSIGAGGRRLRLFVGSGFLYATHTSGYNTFRLTDPFQPVLILARTTAQAGWKQIVANGSGLGMAAVDPNSVDSGAHDVSLYNLGPTGTNNQFITTFPTPGLAAAVCIYNGLAYIADSLSGLQVINYIAYDALGIPPAISLSASFPLSPAVAEEGKSVRITANVTDDVQVRNVEFYVDGVRVAIDGNFPFEHHFVTPLIASTKTNFTVRARVSDTGGNSTWSQEIVVALVPDATPPNVTQVFPIAGAILGQNDLLAAYFNELIAADTLNGATFQLRSAGPDGRLDTPDDAFVTGGTISYRDDLHAAFLKFNTNLGAGLYRGYINPPIADLVGNQLARSFTWQFWITGGQDRDQDGIPDALEAATGTNPNNPDTDNDGILDGDEDFDGDGLATKWELLFGYNPLVKDTDGNGVFDGDEDLDHDGLTNLQEQARHTDASNPDTDGDGWWDEPEVTGGSDPLNPLSKPRLFVVSQPPVGLRLPRSLGTGGLAANVTIATPSVAMVLPSATGTGSFPLNVTVARPSVSVVLPSAIGTALPPNVTVARPTVSVVLPSSIGAVLPANITVTAPLLSIRLPSSVGPAGVSTNVTIARPPTKVHFESP
jgi:hypothetical protein